ncbi:LOW QUALITY PROTEIN: tumor-associated calcium signal transducer 2 [Egretta garzetta]|uniref:LOW QUALITY PROTEIN: tumor-associated calcium signal transducer 2 n=1 Tax=Egretta garzetta TaxID=188379 RepID=UPI00163C2CB6|nr:LOW QUALITY PROTEIN: tumor-associated calcium signal transducer 2 [Egretta garzetta]
MLFTCNMEPLFGFLLGLILAVASSAQNCICATNKWMVCAQDAFGNCTCMLVGSNHRVDCSMLTSKCLLMKAEMVPMKEKRFRGRPRGLLDNDSIYNPDCEESGIFKARQCTQTDTCWCVNTAGVRRTEKGGKSLNCGELVRTSWIYIELKHKKRSSALDVPDVAKVLKHLFESRYKLHPKYIAAVKYDSPLTQICLNQNGSEKSRYDVDTADVACYFEKDMKDESIFHSNSTLTVAGNGHALDIEKIRIYYLDEKPPEFCMKQLVAGISAVVTVVVLTAGLGIAVLVILRWLRTREYEKAEIKEMGEIRAPS